MKLSPVLGGDFEVPLVAAQAYDQVAEIYDSLYADPKSRAEDRAVRRLAGAAGAFGKVLDVGCGTGAFLDMFTIPSNRYVGIDPSLGMLRVARRKHSQHVFLREPAENLSAAPCLFDTVVALYGSFNYADPGLALQEFWRVLKPGGRLFMMVYSKRHARRKTYIMNQLGLVVPHFLYRAEELREWVEQHFVRVQVRGFGALVDAVPHTCPDFVFDAVLATEMVALHRWFHDLGCYLVVTARRDPL